MTERLSMYHDLLRVLVFWWAARLQKILTMDKLLLQNHFIVLDYPLCLQSEVNVNCCSFAQEFSCQASSSLYALFCYLTQGQ